MLKVTCSHVDPRWALDNADFAQVELGEFGERRVGYSGNGDERTYYASAPNFGCGRNCTSERAAITQLLQSQGCTGIRIRHMFEI